MKYYIKKQFIPNKQVHMYAVYEEMPDSMPKSFKRSKLVCFDEYRLTKQLSGNFNVERHQHSMTDAENMNKHLEGFDEIDEETYNILRDGCEQMNAMSNGILTGLGVTWDSKVTWGSVKFGA